MKKTSKGAPVSNFIMLRKRKNLTWLVPFIVERAAAQSLPVATYVEELLMNALAMEYPEIDRKVRARREARSGLDV